MFWILTLDDLAKFSSDRDMDGIIDRTDNCLDLPNSNQSNHDGDSLGDYCDPDDDNDGFDDNIELMMETTSQAGFDGGDNDGVDDTHDAFQMMPAPKPTPMGTVSDEIVIDCITILLSIWMMTMMDMMTEMTIVRHRAVCSPASNDTDGDGVCNQQILMMTEMDTDLDETMFCDGKSDPMALMMFPRLMKT